MKEKLKEKYNIRSYTVRIETENGVGTGFIYIPEESNYAYIFTVYHVVCKLKKGEFRIHYQGKEVPCTNQDVEICVMDATRDLEQQDYFNDDQYEGRREDVAVLRLAKSHFGEKDMFPKEILCFEEKWIRVDSEFSGYGYPDNSDTALELSGTFQRWDDEKKLLICQAENITYPVFETAMKGYSGTGLVTEIQKQLVLVGLVVSCKYDEKYKIFRAVGISEIIKKMNEEGWDIPKKIVGEAIEVVSKKVPENFLETNIMNLECEYMKSIASDVKKDIYNKIYQISQKYNPNEMLLCENFFDIPKCEKSERKVCEYYWAGRLLSLLLLEYANGDAKQKKVALTGGKEVNIEYVCSEGNGKADIASVIASAIRGNVLGEQIKGDCILIWQSSKNPIKRSFKTKRFRNIVSDIAGNNLNELEGTNKWCGYHLLNGEMKNKNYGILHVHELLEHLSECVTIEEVEETVREVLNEIWN